MRKQTLILLIFAIVLAAGTFILLLLFLFNKPQSNQPPGTIPTVTPFQTTKQEKLRREAIRDWRAF